jgi:transcriptional regulator with XRE-family HTH domain
MTGRELSRRSGVGVGTVFNLLKGGSEPTLGTLVALASALSVTSIEQLIAPCGTELLRDVGGSRPEADRTTRSVSI